MRSSVARLARRVARWSRRVGRALRGRVARRDASLELELRRAGQTFDGWWMRRQARGDRRLHTDLSDESVARLAELAPDDAKRTLDRAETLLEHRFDLLGSGPHVPDAPLRAGADTRATRAVRPIRPIRPIDWALDPVAGARFPTDVAHRDFDLAAMRPEGGDVKRPWELGRCQHWPVLAQAWRLSGDARFAHEIAAQLRDFRESNPVGRGVQWACTMDVALRAVSWAIALEGIRSAPQIDAAFWREAYTALFEHGAFVAANLENQAEVTSNHFLSNLLGLQFVGAVFRDLPRGVQWGEFSRGQIQRELGIQVLDDGADFESSVPYHRMVTEMFLAAVRLAEWQHEPLPPALVTRVRSMLKFLASVLRPDGLMPQLGDADDGRLHQLSGYGERSPADPRHVFGPAAMLLHEPSWWTFAGPSGVWEAGWWGFDPEHLRPEPGVAETDVARLFPDAGLAVVRRAGHHLIVANGRVGTEGIGNHKHNDQLSFEFHCAGVPLVVDPGTGVYTGDPAERNRFRSTAFHNTLRVDGAEQNELRPEWLFRLIERAHPEHRSFREEPGFVEYCGLHHGYERLADPVEHRRAVRLLLREGVLLVLDRLRGRGRHRVEWHFHLAPGVAVERLEVGGVALRAASRAFRMTWDGEAAARTAPVAASPSYGVRLACTAIDLRDDVGLDEGDAVRFFALGPAPELAAAAASRALARHRDEMAEATA